MSDNPFFSPSTLPYQLPPFADIRDEHYLPAFERGLAEHRAEIDAITNAPQQPTFDNTIVAMERSGRVLERVSAVFFNKCAADADAVTDALEEQLAPRLAAHHDAIRLDSALFARIQAIHEALDDLGLDAESRHLVRRIHTEFTLAGAGLDEVDKAQLRGYNKQLSLLTTRFQKHLLADTNELAVVVTDLAELDGLRSGEISAAAQAAADRGLEGCWMLTLVLPTSQPHLATLTNRGVRRRLMTAARSRGARGGEHDTRALVLDIARLRAERAGLLGFDSHAAYVTADETAKTPQAVASMLGRLAPSAAQNAREEAATLQGQADTEQDAAGLPRFELASWDWAFYSERVRAARYAVDTAAMRPYFELERVLQDGVFFAATQLYGVRFSERPDLVAYHPEARVYEVTDADGSPVGLYIADLYTRDSKRGGAWMNPLVSHSRLLADPVVVVNNMNISKPAPGQPTLLAYDEVTTLFHEFGHALHGLFARVTYPRFTGLNVHRDFVEFPSQVNEMWMLWPEVLSNYAVHHQTGEAMPRDLVERIKASVTFDEGYATSSYLAAALLDQAWHTMGAADAVTDVAAFEAQSLADVGLDHPAVPPRYGSTYFAHVFAGDYDAAYYSYIWSEVLDADTVEWFGDNGGLTRDNGDRFRRLLLGVGGSKDPLEAYRDFRGRDADIGPLLARRGLAT
ncbi:MAG TPA: M3 family metallopeptidase [Euzebya sp.]|nr:M3 family metallopeptidase [Euzebya sp.]